MGVSTRVKPRSWKKSRQARADFVPDAQDGLLAGGAQPQVAVVHEKPHAVFLGGDGVFLGDEHRGAAR